MTTKAKTIQRCQCGCGGQLRPTHGHRLFLPNHNPHKVYVRKKPGPCEQPRPITETRPDACLKCGSLSIYQGMPSMESPFVWWECFMCGKQWFN